MEKKKSKILIVDDEPEMVEALRNFFSSEGYEIIAAFSGEEALDILGREKADLILLDIMMPGLKGTEVAKVVRERYPSVKLIIITGHPEEEKKISGDVTIDGFFTKPIAIHQLYTKLLDLFEQTQGSLSDLRSRQVIKARMLFIKARLLFIEPSPEIFLCLSSHLKRLSNRGENYELEVARTVEESIEKVTHFEPDMLIINMSYVDEVDKDFLKKIYQLPHKPKEAIIYTISDSRMPDQAELDRLTKSIQLFCLRNGLMEIKWIEI